MNPPLLERDERVVMVENASYRWACQVLSFGLLMDAVYRSWVRHESTWDLLGLVIVGGGVAAAYQGNNRILGRRWARTVGAAAILAAVIALLIVLFRR
jgi:1,4-dihydroxy-2-naphthoate octaprenyltransferase